MTGPAWRGWDGLGIAEDGMTAHLPFPVTRDGQGPASADEAHHLICWCGTDCPLARELVRAFEWGRADGAAAARVGGGDPPTGTDPATLEMLALGIPVPVCPGCQVRRFVGHGPLCPDCCEATVPNPSRP